MQSNKHVNPFLSKNNELDQLLGLQQTQQREQIEFYPQSQENVDWQHGQHDQPVAIFEQVPQRSMGEQRRQPEPAAVESQGYELRWRDTMFTEDDAGTVSNTVDLRRETVPSKKAEVLTIGLDSRAEDDQSAQAALNFQRRMEERKRLMEEKKMAKVE